MTRLAGAVMVVAVLFVAATTIVCRLHEVGEAGEALLDDDAD